MPDRLVCGHLWRYGMAVTTMKRFATDPGKGLIFIFGLAFFAVSTGTSYAHWANFEYRTFDLAYYVQAIWQLVHGRFQVTVEGVPLLGNHVEPVVFLLTPFFLLFPHPLVLVALQNAALASMGPVAFSVGKRLGLDRGSALCLACAILLTPATSYVALHEFHPEAFTAPFLLLMFRARLRRSLSAHWGWLLAVLACKENMALLLATYCAVHIFIERKRPIAELRAWYVWPMAWSVLWFLICVKLITPRLNSGNIDYLALYDRLGASAGDILAKAITQPQRILGALFQSLSHGNLLWALLLPFLAVPLLKPRWLLIATPILLQHLLSWRSSEWTISFHYAAPLLPLFWIALAEATVGVESRGTVPGSIRRSFYFLIIAACVTGQILLGPASEIATTATTWFDGEQNRARKRAVVNQIPPDASVLAPLPYLSHLAMREKLYSLHYVLKGLGTLSRSTYEPPAPTDFVLIDYDDSATFDAVAGYYHPAMKTIDDRVIPSSDRLLHQFLQRCSWTVHSSDGLTLLRQSKSPREVIPASPSPGGIVEMGTGVTLINITKSGEELTEEGLDIELNWNFQNPRDVFPWMFLKMTSPDHRNGIILSKGLCAPEAMNGPHRESWHITPDRIPDGNYGVEAVFVDNAKRVWAAQSGQRDPQMWLTRSVPLGKLRVAHKGNKAAPN